MSLDGSPPGVTQRGFLVILSCDSNYSPDSSSSSDVSPSVLLPPSSSGLELSASPVEPLPAVAAVSVVVPPVLYNGAKQSLISCSVGVVSLLPSSALDISSSEASPPNKHCINCWKFPPSSTDPVSAGESVSGVLPGLDGVSNVDWA